MAALRSPGLGSPAEPMHCVLVMLKQCCYSSDVSVTLGQWVRSPACFAAFSFVQLTSEGVHLCQMNFVPMVLPVAGGWRLGCHAVFACWPVDHCTVMY